MSIHFTWSELALWLLAFLVPYYICCTLLFYWSKLKNAIHKKSATRWEPHSSSRLSDSEPIREKETRSEDMLHTHVHELMNEIQKVFDATIDNNLTQDQILEAIKYRLAKYPLIKSTSFQEAVNNYMAVELQNTCGIFLSRDEIEKLW